MKILFLSQRFILPMDTGGKIRTGNILRQLAKCHDVTVISNVEYAKEGHLVNEMEEFCSRFVPVPWVELRRNTLRFYLRLTTQMFSRDPVSALNTYSKDMGEAVARECARGDYDVLVCDFVQSGRLIGSDNATPVLLFQHNVESIIARRHMEQAGSWLTRAFWWLQWRRMHRYERSQCRRFDQIVTVSDADGETIADLYDVHGSVAIPTGVDTTYFAPPDSPPDPHRIAFCGSMDWLPNEDGVAWFLEEILPRVQAAIPEADFLVVGRSPTPPIQKAAQARSNVALTGWVDDTRPHLGTAAVFVVPLRIGGGTRMKIYEAMAMSRAVVSTTIGAEGLPVEHGRHCYLEDDPQAFADRIIELLSDQSRRDGLGDAARAYVTDRFSWENVTRTFVEACEQARGARVE